MTNILVTGCAGFIGSHVCEYLLKHTNNNIYGIDNFDPYYDISLKHKNIELLIKYDNFTFKQDDICNTTIISDIKFDKIIHLASMAGVRYSIENPKKYFNVNVIGFIHILEESVKNNVPKIVYASSSSVYGKNKKLPFHENDPVNLCYSPYACSKLTMEKLANVYNQLHNISLIGMRFFTVYGPRGRPDMAPRKFMESIKYGKPIQKYGNGDSYRDYTYIDDIVSGIIKITNSDINCDIFNLGNDKPITLNTFIETCEKIVGKKAIINYLDDQKGDVPYTHADISKAKNIIGYSPKYSLMEGLQKMNESI